MKSSFKIFIFYIFLLSFCNPLLAKSVLPVKLSLELTGEYLNYHIKGIDVFSKYILFLRSSNFKRIIKEGGAIARVKGKIYCKDLNDGEYFLDLQVFINNLSYSVSRKFYIKHGQVFAKKKQLKRPAIYKVTRIQKSTFNTSAQIYGRFFYNDINSGKNFPLKNALVVLCESSTENPIQSTYTNENGEFFFYGSFISGKQYFVKLKLVSMSKYGIALMHNPYSKVIWEIRSPSKTYSFFINFGDMVCEGEEAAACNVYSQCLKGAYIYVDVCGRKIKNALSVFFENDYLAPSGVSYYEDNEIHIEGYEDDPDQWDNGVILHEYGHYIMDEIYGGEKPKGVNGSHFTELPATSSNQIALNLAFSEGWAHFFACTALKQAGYEDKNAGGKNTYNFETTDPVTGNDIEKSVAGVLLDIVDGPANGFSENDSEDNDNLSLPVNLVLDALEFDPVPGSKKINHPWTLHDILTGIIYNNPEYKDKIAEIVKAHGCILLLSPFFVNSETSVSPSLQFSANLNETVELSISEDSEFNNAMSIQLNKEIYVPSLLPNRTYYWRVIGTDYKGYKFDTAAHIYYQDTSAGKSMPATRPYGNFYFKTKSTTFSIVILFENFFQSDINLNKDITKALISELSTGDKVSIIEYNEFTKEVVTSVLIDSDEDKRNLKSIIETIEPSSNNFLDLTTGLTAAKNLFDFKSDFQKAIFIIGTAGHKNSDFKISRASFIENNISVFGVVPKDSEAYLKIKEFCEDTGGICEKSIQFDLISAVLNYLTYLRRCSKLVYIKSLIPGNAIKEYKFSLPDKALKIYLVSEKKGLKLKLNSNLQEYFLDLSEERSGTIEVLNQNRANISFLIENSSSESITFNLEVFSLDKENYFVFPSFKFEKNKEHLFKIHSFSGKKPEIVVFNPKGEQINFDINDSGKNGDFISNDGIFSGYITPGIEGIFTINVSDSSRLFIPCFNNFSEGFNSKLFIDTGGLKPEVAKEVPIKNTELEFFMQVIGKADGEYKLTLSSKNFGIVSYRPYLFTDYFARFKLPVTLKEGIYKLTYKINPEITYTFNVFEDSPEFFNLSPYEGEKVYELNPTFTADIKDNGSGVDENSVRLVVDGITYEVYSDSFDNSSGRLVYRLPVTLTEGEHTYRVYAKDKVGKSAYSKWVSFYITTEFSFDLDNTYCYPSPFTPAKEDLNIKYSVGKEVYITIRIYDSAGYKIKTIVENEMSNKGTNENYKWDGRDKKGRIVHTGIYFVKIIATNPDNGNKKDIVKKIALIRY